MSDGRLFGSAAPADAAELAMHRRSWLALALFLLYALDILLVVLVAPRLLFDVSGMYPGEDYDPVALIWIGIAYGLPILLVGVGLSFFLRGEVWKDPGTRHRLVFVVAAPLVYLLPLSALYVSPPVNVAHLRIQMWAGRHGFAGANLKGADLGELDLHEINLSGAHLSGANLAGADLRGADLNRADLSRAILTGANLAGARLYSAKLIGCDLSGASLSKASLAETSLAKANLSAADLTQANLSGADLRGAILTGANLNEATLAGANLTGATVTARQLTQAKSLRGATMPDGTVHK